MSPGRLTLITEIRLAPTGTTFTTVVSLPSPLYPLYFPQGHRSGTTPCAKRGLRWFLDAVRHPARANTMFEHLPGAERHARARRSPSRGDTCPGGIDALTRAGQSGANAGCKGHRSARRISHRPSAGARDACSGAPTTAAHESAGQPVAWNGNGRRAGAGTQPNTWVSIPGTGFGNRPFYAYCAFRIQLKGEPWPAWIITVSLRNCSPTNVLVGAAQAHVTLADRRDRIVGRVAVGHAAEGRARARRSPAEGRVGAQQGGNRRRAPDPPRDTRAESA